MAEHTIKITISSEQHLDWVKADIENVLLNSPSVSHFIVEMDPAEVCPYDCDSCHDSDCPCTRMGCAGSGVTFDD